MLFDPISIGKMTIKNRMAFPPITTGFGTINGCPTDRETDYFVERAKGGAGLIFSSAVAVDREHQHSTSAPLPYLDDDELISGFAHFTSAMHNEGAKTCIQLYHAGRQTTSAKRGGKPPLAPSAMSTSMLGFIPYPDAIEMTLEDIEYAIQSFVSAAVRAKAAGFDAIDLDGGGYLIGEFMSPYTNKRSDAWGGSFENRMRFPLEIIKRTRAKIGKDFPIFFDLPMDDAVPGGITPQEGVKMAVALEENGVHAIRIHPGVAETYSYFIPTMAIPRAVFAPFGKMLKSALSTTKVMLGQRINNPELAERLLQEEVCDIVLLGRPLLADPYFPRKAMTGRTKEIRTCLACNSCLDELSVSNRLKCAVNAQVGFEKEYRIEKAEHKKTVLIVGGGPAGTEAARVAALQGHKVILCEKSDALGGEVIYASIPPYKEELSGLVDYYRTQMKVLGVDVRLNTWVDRKYIENLGPDAVVIATGARPIELKIPGAEDKRVFSVKEVLSRPSIGDKKKVVIVGGGTVGAEIAELLWSRDKEVTVLEMSRGIAKDMGFMLRLDFQKRISNTGISFVTGATVTEITPNSVVYHTKAGEHKIAADAVVMAVGYQSENTLAQELIGINAEMIVVGDALSPRKIMDAIHEGFHAARRLNYSYNDF